MLSSSIPILSPSNQICGNVGKHGHGSSLHVSSTSKHQVCKYSNNSNARPGRQRCSGGPVRSFNLSVCRNCNLEHETDQQPPSRLLLVLSLYWLHWHSDSTLQIVQSGPLSSLPTLIADLTCALSQVATVSPVSCLYLQSSILMAPWRCPDSENMSITAQSPHLARHWHCP